MEAAWDLARRDGIASLSMRDLAAAVGMQAPSLYHHFAGKHAIYDAMFAKGHAEVDRRLAALALPDDPDEALTAGVEEWLAVCREDWTRYQLLYTRVIPGWEPSPEAYEASLTSFRHMQDVAAAAGIAGADLDLFTAITSGLAAQQFANEPGGDRWTAQAPRAIHMLLTHVGRPPRGSEPDHPPPEATS